MIPGVDTKLCLGPDNLQGGFMECLTDVLCECPDWDGGGDHLHSGVIVVLGDGDRFQNLTSLLGDKGEIRRPAFLRVMIDGDDRCLLHIAIARFVMFIS